MSGLHTSSRPRSFGVDGLRVCREPCQQCCQPTHLQAPRMVEHFKAVLPNAGLILRLDLWWCWFQKYHRPQAPACSGRQETQEGPLCSRACLVRHERTKCKRQESDHAKNFQSFKLSHRSIPSQLSWLMSRHRNSTSAIAHESPCANIRSTTSRSAQN